MEINNKIPTGRKRNPLFIREFSERRRIEKDFAQTGRTTDVDRVKNAIKNLKKGVYTL